MVDHAYEDDHDEHSCPRCRLRRLLWSGLVRSGPEDYRRLLDHLLDSVELVRGLDDWSDDVTLPADAAEQLVELIDYVYGIAADDPAE